MRQRDPEAMSTARIVEIDNLLERSVDTVVHVRRSERDVAQRRRLEREEVLIDAAHVEAPGIRIDRVMSP